MREIHPYRKVSERKKTLLANLSVTSLKSACHCFIVIHNWGGSRCRLYRLLWVEKVFPSTLLVTPSFSFCRSVSHVPGSFLLYLNFSIILTALLFLESSLFLAPPPLLNQLWPSSLSCSSVSPFFLSRVGGHTWIQYDDSTFIPPLSCLCMSLSVLLLTSPCTPPPHLSFFFFAPLCCLL